MDLEQQVWETKTFKMLELLKRASGLAEPGSRFYFQVGSISTPSDLDSQEQRKIFQNLAKMGVIQYEAIRPEISTLMSNDAYYKAATSQSGTHFMVKINHPQFEKLFRKYAALLDKRDKKDQKYDTLIYLKAGILFYKGERLKKSAETRESILMEACCHLQPQGGVIKYKDLVKEMTKLGVEKIGNKRLIDSKGIREAVYRLQRSKFLTKGGENIFEIKRGYGVIFNNEVG